MRLPIAADGEALFRRIEEMPGLAEQVDEQAIVVDPFLADQLAMIIMALERALDGAFVGDRAKSARPEDMRGFAGGVERARVGAAAYAVDGLLGKADPRRRLAGDAGVGQRLDEGALPLGGQTILAVAQGYRVEGERIGTRRPRRRIEGGGRLSGRGPGRDASRILLHPTG
jgi:hypothetical protein